MSLRRPRLVSSSTCWWVRTVNIGWVDTTSLCEGEAHDPAHSTPGPHVFLSGDFSVGDHQACPKQERICVLGDDAIHDACLFQCNTHGLAFTRSLPTDPRHNTPSKHVSSTRLPLCAQHPAPLRTCTTGTPRASRTLRQSRDHRASSPRGTYTRPRPLPRPLPLPLPPRPRLRLLGPARAGMSASITPAARMCMRRTFCRRSCRASLLKLGGAPSHTHTTRIPSAASRATRWKTSRTCGCGSLSDLRRPGSAWCTHSDRSTARRRPV